MKGLKISIMKVPKRKRRAFVVDDKKKATIHVLGYLNSYGEKYIKDNLERR